MSLNFFKCKQKTVLSQERPKVGDAATSAIQVSSKSASAPLIMKNALRPSTSSSSSMTGTTAEVKKATAPSFSKTGTKDTTLVKKAKKATTEVQLSPTPSSSDAIMEVMQDPAMEVAATRKATAKKAAANKGVATKAANKSAKLAAIETTATPLGRSDKGKGPH